MNFESILRKKDWMELLKKINNKRIRLLWVYGKHLKIMRWQPAITKTFDWIEINKETINLYHRNDKWRTWVIYKHHNSNNSQGKLLGEIQPKITPTNKLKGWKDLLNKKMMGLNISFLTTCESWNMKELSKMT